MDAITTTTITHDEMLGLVPELLKIERATFAHEPFDVADFQDIAHHSHPTLVIARHAKKVIGYALATPLEYFEDEITPPLESLARDPTTSAYLNNIAVLPEFQNQKIGTKLLSLMEHELKKRGFVFLEMHALTSSGFSAIARNRYQDRLIVSIPGQQSEWGEQEFLIVRLMQEPH